MKKESLGNDVIYILLSYAKKVFLVLRGHKDSLRETYRHHLAGRRFVSKNFVESLLPERPCIFILEEIDPEDEANLLLVWLKIMEDQGYISCNHPDIIEQAEHLYIDNMVAYNKRKTTDLSKILNCEKCLIPTFKKKTCVRYSTVGKGSNQATTEILSYHCTKKRRKEIRFHVTETEYEMILQQAKKLGMQQNAYICYTAKNPTIIYCDYTPILQHTQEIGEIRNCINRFIFTIEATNNYLPREIETILNLMQEILKTENKLLETMRKQRQG